MSPTLLLVLSVANGAAPPEALPLETLLAAPQYGSLLAAPAGDAFAFVENRRGARNVWVATGAPLAARKVTQFTEDDGQAISMLSLSRAGDALAFMRGGPNGPDGLAPDPLSSTSGARLEVWTWRAGEGVSRRGDGHSPAISPDGAVLAYARGAKLVIGPMAAEGEDRTLQLRGRVSSLRWSPDGRRLAFVSDRGDHSIVGVYEREGGAVTWMAPGFGVDQVPCWSSDGARVAFVRLPPASVAAIVGVERPRTYELWVADARTGEGLLAFRSGDATTDDAREVSLEWAGADRLVFVWERDGWARVHALDPGGAEPIALSPPGCEAGSPHPSADGAQVVFSANCGDPDRLHLWVAPVRGGAPRQLTVGRGIEALPVAGARTVVYLAATGRAPETPHAVRLDASEPPRALVPDALAGFPLDALVEPEPIVVRAEDGASSRGQLFRRPDVRGRRAAVLFVHGGPSRQMLLGWHPMGYYHRAYALNQHLASKGYVVLSVNYRGGVGYGREFRKKRDAINARDYLDVVAAARWLQARPDVDPARVGIWGGSHGGYLTALALARNSDLFAAGVDLAGMTSFILDVERWRSPVLVVHGDHDPTVPFGQTMDLIRRLKALERPPVVEALMLPDEQHTYLRHGSWLRVFEAASDFLDRHLRPAPPRAGRSSFGRTRRVHFGP